MTRTLAPQVDSYRFARSKNGISRKVAENLFLALAYFLTAPLGQLLAITPGNVTPVWIPSGIVFAAALMRGRRVWSGIFLGAFAGNVWVYLDVSSLENVTRAIFSGTANGIGDVLGAFAGASLIRKYGGTSPLFDTGRGAIVFIVCGALFAGAISAVFGVAGLALARFISWSEFAKVWVTWSVGDVMSIMILTPLILEWRIWKRHRLTARQHLEIGVMLAVLAFVTLCSMEVVFPVKTHFPFLIILPLLIPPVFRFHKGVTFIALLITCVLTIVATVLGKGPFLENPLNTALIELQLFLGMVTATIYILSGVVTERRLAEQSLGKTTAELDETRLSLMGAERMGTIGKIASGVAHEVKNPLAIITLGIDYLNRKIGDSDPVATTVIEEMQHAVVRANSIVLGLLDFAAPRKLTLDNIPMEELIREARRLTDHALAKHKVELSATLPENLPVLRMDREKCVQVLVNLILNACHAIQSNGKVHLLVQVRDKPSGSTVEMAVEDDGPGLPEQVLPRLFEPFFTTKKSEGTGLGLSVSRMIMRLHDGDLTAENRQEGGACFLMTWPVRTAEPPYFEI